MKSYYSKIEKINSFDFHKKEDRLPLNFKLNFKKSKNIQSCNLSSQIELDKGGMVFVPKAKVPTKTKENYLFKDTQKNKMDLNIIKRYHQVFKKESANIYTNEYIRKVSRLLYKNEKNYFYKKRSLNASPELIEGRKIEKNSFAYITQFSENLLESNQELEKKFLTYNDSIVNKDNDKYSLNDTFDSNESIELTNSQVKRLNNNLDKEHDFYRGIMNNLNHEMIKHQEKLPIILNIPKKALDISTRNNTKIFADKNLKMITTPLKKNKSNIGFENKTEIKIRELLKNLEKRRENKIENFLSDFDY